MPDSSLIQDLLAGNGVGVARVDELEGALVGASQGEKQGHSNILDYLATSCIRQTPLMQ